MVAAHDYHFAELPEADLVVGATYRGGIAGTLADEPLDKLLHCGNMGGFRIRGRKPAYSLVVLFTTFADRDWPDELDEPSGRFVYYGDNKKPGCELHDTSKGGNAFLRHCFDQIHLDPARRDLVPPAFVFSKAGRGRDVVFHGLAAAGGSGLAQSEDLAVDTYDTQDNQGFHNYRAVFTILDIPVVDRRWLNGLVAGVRDLAGAPPAWRDWVVNGNYRALASGD